VNPSGWRLLGLEEGAGQHRSFADIAGAVAMRDEAGRAVAPADQPLARALRDEAVERVEVVVHNALFGDDRYLRLSARPLHNAEGMIVGAVAVAADVTDVKETQLALSAQARTLRQLNAQLSRLVTRDTLTGLLNRRGFEEEVEAAIARARESGEPLGLIVIDVDRFKQVNDTHGHPAGDAVLTAIAERIVGAVRGTGAAARLGGDEFAVILPNTDQAGAVTL